MKLFVSDGEMGRVRVMGADLIGMYNQIISNTADTNWNLLAHAEQYL